MKDRDLEKKRIFWSGDRIEWILVRALTRGFSRKTTKGGCCGQALRYPRRLIEIPPKLIGSRPWGLCEGIDQGQRGIAPRRASVP
jgi:hypothetical protein